MRIEDWRGAPASLVQPALDAERARWADGLQWDLAASWTLVDAARRDGRLPGYVARDSEGRVAGWTFFVVTDDTLQIGALTGTSAAAVRLLLDRVLDSPEAAHARRVSLFLWPQGREVAVAVARRRFVMRRHLYMAAALGATSRRTAGGHNAVLRSWRPDDAADAVRLLADAYRGESAAECFAPHGRLEEWARYVGQLLHTPGCGHFLPVGTAVARERLWNTLAGLAMVTDLAPGVAHLAQMAVAPTMRGTGLGARLLAHAMDAAADAGRHTMTLLVAEDNAPARRLYESAGFTERAAFLYASRPMPNRLSRAA